MQQKGASFILEWAENYVKHRDMIFGRIDKIDKQQNRLLVTYKDGSVEQILPYPDLEIVDITKIKPAVTIITLNTKHNFDVLIKKWKSFSETKDLKMIFFNPESEIEKRWIIKPYVHNRICDDKSLKQGLKAMFDTVEALA